MNSRSLLVVAAAAAAVVVGSVVSPSPSFAKGKSLPPPPKTGVNPLPNPNGGYVQMGVPKDYDARKWYPLFFYLDNAGTGNETPDAWVAAWSEGLLAKGWIVAGPHLGPSTYDNEESIEPIKKALALVKETYKVDDRRVVLAGFAAGALMAWRMAVRAPELWAGVLAVNGEISGSDQGQVKKLAGKPAYLFTGANDTFYTPAMAERDKRYLEGGKVVVTLEVKPDWSRDFPITSLPKIVEWLGSVWPPGAYREKAEAVEQALKAKDVAAIQPALAALAAELHKNPYPAYEARLAEYGEKLLAIAREMIADAKKMLAVDPLKALDEAEAVVKKLKGLKPADAEAVAARNALQKEPAVVEALRKKQAEASAAQYMEKAEAAEAKGDLAKALDLYKKIVALGESSKKAEAEAKVKELEPKVGGGGG